MVTFPRIFDSPKELTVSEKLHKKDGNAYDDNLSMHLFL
jgi:hypothetical protein